MDTPRSSPEVNSHPTTVSDFLKSLGFAAMPESSRQRISERSNLGETIAEVLKLLFPEFTPDSMLGLFSGSARVEQQIIKEVATVKRATIVDLSFPEKPIAAQSSSVIDFIEADVFQFLMDRLHHDQKYAFVFASAYGFLFSMNEQEILDIEFQFRGNTIRFNSKSEVLIYIFQHYLPKILKDEAIIILTDEQAPPLFDNIPGFTRIPFSGLQIYSFKRRDDF